jgi:glycosyltransferase involved in cell wall biosynthesis
MIAFACNPAGGGEHWLGWGWAEQAAKFCDVTLLAWDRFGAEIKRRAPELGINPVCVGVPSIVNYFGDRSGTGRWLRQLIWHRRALPIAARMHRQQPFALAHQTTFHTFRIPVRPASWGIPAVWGPIAGGEFIPPGFDDWVGRLKTGERLRRQVNKLSLLNPSIRKSLRLARAIFVSNHTTLRFLPEWCHERCTIVPPNTLRGETPAVVPRTLTKGQPLKLLFVGNCLGTRSIPLVFEALSRLTDVPWHLTVAGNGSSLADWKRLAQEKSFGEKVTFTGQVPRDAVQQLYAQADVFVFPALRDSGGSGLLEAMTLGLPVVCCDWAGPAEMVDEGSGVKVSVASPETTIREFAETFKRLYNDDRWRVQLGQNAAERSRRNFSWESKRALLEATYARCLGGKA